MNNVEDKFWPFDVLPESKRTELHQKQIDFLESAYEDGFQPYVTSSYDFGASSVECNGLIVHRGHRDRRWELFLAEGQERILTAHIDGFEFAAHALIQWLKIMDVEIILDEVNNHLYSKKYPATIHLLGSQKLIEVESRF